MSHPAPPSAPLSFHGGVVGALVPFALFLAGVSWLGLSGAPDETGFWPVLLMAIALGLFLATDKSAYCDAVIDGMSRRIVMIMLLAWLLASVLGVLLRESGLVGSLVWATDAAGVSGGGFVAVSFLVCVVFSTATGTSLGTILVCAPLLYPAGASLAADPAFLIGSIIAGATFGDNVSPISDTTIASATTQGAKLGDVVRSRLKYAIPAAAVALLVFVLFGGSGTAAEGLQTEPDALGLLMLAVPALVLTVLIRQRHLVEGLIYGIVSASLLGLALGRFGFADLLSIDQDNFTATGLLLDGMRRAIGVSIFTVLLMGLVGGLERAGLLDRLTDWVRARATSTKSAEWWIFGTVSGATVLTTHSTVAIVTVGEMARDIGEASGVGANRRANILDIAVCTYPFLLPIFIPTVLAASMTADVIGMPRLSPWDVGLHNVHSWALLAVLVFAIATGWGRTAQDPA
ncbi:MAG: Na+/H+ antiporter NhaC family protein [Gemmatimonadota bacterium]|nr:Na+/H+ antiporter NhaC family protein [Gemmatimonadota bacterium]